jgi:cytochrome oxidase assembly protein ShyY1
VGVARYRCRVLRTALKPRWLALLLLMLLAATLMAKLGEWQLDRARSHGKSAEQAQLARQSATTVPLDSVLRASETFPKDGVNKKVTTTGHWQGENQLLVPGRKVGGKTGLWVLTPLITTDGTTVPVVRGWVPTAADPAATAPADTTEVTVVGLIEPGEPPAVRTPGQTDGLPQGQIDRVAVAQLAGIWPQPMTTGFIVMESQSPAAANSLTPVPPPAASGQLDWGNLSYAIQWWLFSLIGLLFWYRLVRDDHRGLLRGSDEDGDGDDADDADDKGTEDGTTVVSRQADNQQTV